MAIIRLSELAVTKNGRRIGYVPDLRIDQGQTQFLVGRNGSGKTTILRVLAGLERKYAGRCDVSTSHRERVYVHQAPYLFSGSVLANVSYGMHGLHSRTEIRRRAMHWLAQVGMEQFASAESSQLSGGERRRVAIARGLAVEPRLLLLDEPFAELDAPGAELLTNLLQTLKDTTLVITSPNGQPGDWPDARRFELISSM